jgi:hypothetical protein
MGGYCGVVSAWYPPEWPTNPLWSNIWDAGGKPKKWPPNPEIITVNPQRKCYDLNNLIYRSITLPGIFYFHRNVSSIFPSCSHEVAKHKSGPIPSDGTTISHNIKEDGKAIRTNGERPVTSKQKHVRG